MNFKNEDGLFWLFLGMIGFVVFIYTLVTGFQIADSFRSSGIPAPVLALIGSTFLFYVSWIYFKYGNELEII